MRWRIYILATAMALAACGRTDETAVEPRGSDPLVMAALNAPIASDPDLASLNRANAVAAFPAVEGSVPSLDTGAEAIARARADALSLVGGPGQMRQAPKPSRLDASLAAGADLSAAARAASVPGIGACAAKVDYTAAWAARLPPNFPVYPRGAVQEAAGTDRDGCLLRVVNFQTPVPVDEVIDFYFSRAGTAGFSSRHMLQNGDDVLSGAKGRASYAVYARQLANGATEVDLVTSG